MEILAAVLRQAESPMRLERLQLAAPCEDELVVEISHVGVCHTDIGVQAIHPLPAVLGHEGLGTVVECGSQIKDLKEGDLVALTFGYCGACRNCLNSLPSHCFHMPDLNFSGLSSVGKPTLTDANGGDVHGSFFYQSSFASHALVNERNAIRVPDDIPHELVAPLGCGVQTGAGAVSNTLRIGKGSSFACIGVGAVGLSAVMAARRAQCAQIIAVDHNLDRLSLAKDLGATHTIVSSESVTPEILSITNGGADYSLDTAGQVSTFHAAIACVRMGGHVGLAAVPNWQEGFHFNPSSLALGRTVTGVIEGSSRPKTFVPELCQWIRDGDLPLDRIVTGYAFGEINQALDDLRTGDVIKPILKM